MTRNKEERVIKRRSFKLKLRITSDAEETRKAFERAKMLLIAMRLNNNQMKKFNDFCAAKNIPVPTNQAIRQLLRRTSL